MTSTLHVDKILYAGIISGLYLQIFTLYIHVVVAVIDGATGNYDGSVVLVNNKATSSANTYTMNL